jgi:protein MpaA
MKYFSSLSLFLFLSEKALGFLLSPAPLTQGFRSIPFVSEESLPQYRVSDPKKSLSLFCHRLKKEYKRYRWTDDPCQGVPWKIDYQSKDGHPLVYTSFGEGTNTTLFLGGVHPDEITPIHMAFRLGGFLKDNPHLYAKETNHRIVLAPLVSPDGFFLDKPLRTNSLVDVNRNFLTQDWYEHGRGALDTWRMKKKSQDRYFPGYFPNTEIETFFQTQLIDDFQVKKIFTIHAPLGFYDFDGPGDQKSHQTTESEQRTKEFVASLSKKSAGYKIMVYNVYPGSLGNYAGKERKIPTVTLELETANPQMVENYWQRFLPGFLHSIQYQFSKLALLKGGPKGQVPNP